jgi:hypothetical protein
MPKSKAKAAEGPRVVAGRRQFLVYFDPDLIKEVKREAVSLGISASDFVEQAAREWLKRGRKGGAAGGRRK